MSARESGRRISVLVGGVVLQISLGSVYAWSYFQKPIMEAYGWNNSQTMWVFSLAILFLGLSAAWAGAALPRLGPRRLAVTGSILYGLGWAAGSLAMSVHSLPLFYAGFGVMGGIGLGLGYVTPVATVAKWFPGRKGLATGAVVMGFGLGALFMSKLLSPFLLSSSGGSLPGTFLLAGAVLGAMALCSALLLKNPPRATLPAPPPVDDKPTGRARRLLPRGESARFILLWFMFFSIITAGIMFIGLQSPLFQDLLAHSGAGLDAVSLAAAGATLVAVSSLCNGLGRILWGAVSDRLGRVATFRLIMGTLALALAAMALVRSPAAFFALVCYALLCYGGGFGTMPSTIGELFGPERMPLLYGIMLTAWAAGGVVGPQAAAAFKDAGYPAWVSFVSAASLVALGFILTWAVPWKRARR